MSMDLQTTNGRARQRKSAWQRQQRAAFVAAHGYSTKAHYETGGLREQVLERDGRQCVRCGLTDAEHRAQWGRPITVDHIDKDRSHNTLDNLQTLCLRCHGSKDLIPGLRTPRVAEHQADILARRAGGETYQAIADAHGFSIGAVWKWVRRWETEEQRP